MLLNKVMIIGNIGQDPEVNETSGGVKVAKITVADSGENGTRRIINH